MKQNRNVPQKRGLLGTPKNLRTNSRRYSLTAKGIAFVQDCNAKLGAIAEDENLPRPTAKIDAIIAEIRAPKPAPTECRYCHCTSIEIATVGKHAPAYFCRLCDAHLQDVNPEINVKWELSRKYEDLLIYLPRVPLSDDAKFAETLETIQLIRSEILNMESK